MTIGIESLNNKEASSGISTARHVDTTTNSSRNITVVNRSRDSSRAIEADSKGTHASHPAATDQRVALEKLLRHRTRRVRCYPLAFEHMKVAAIRRVITRGIMAWIPVLLVVAWVAVREIAVACSAITA